MVTKEVGAEAMGALGLSMKIHQKKTIMEEVKITIEGFKEEGVMTGGAAEAALDQTVRRLWLNLGRVTQLSPAGEGEEAMPGVEEEEDWITVEEVAEEDLGTVMEEEDLRAVKKVGEEAWRRVEEVGEEDSRTVKKVGEEDLGTAKEEEDLRTVKKVGEGDLRTVMEEEEEASRTVMEEEE